MLLNEPRRLYQLFRLSGLEAIRIEAATSIIPSSTTITNRIPISFACTMLRNPIALTRLLHERVIDMWISHAPPDRHTLDALQSTDQLLITISTNGAGSSDGLQNHLRCLREISGTAAFEVILTTINQP